MCVHVSAVTERRLSLLTSYSDAAAVCLQSYTMSFREAASESSAVIHQTLPEIIQGQRAANNMEQRK